MFGTLRSPLARRLAALFIVASILPLAAAGYLILRDIESTTRADSEQRQAALARAAAEIVRQWIARSSDQFAALGKLDQKKSGPLLDKVEHAIKSSKLFLEINQIADPAKNPRLVGQRAQQEYVQAQTMNGNLAKQRTRQFVENLKIARDVADKRQLIQGTEPLDNAGFRSLQVTTPYLSKTGPAGALVGYLDLRRLDELLSPLTTDGRELRIENEAGKQIARVGDTIEDPVAHTAPVGYSDWHVRVAEPRAKAEASMRRARRRALWGLFAALAIACCASLFFASRILKPVRTLTDSATRLEAGDLSTRSGIDRSDEIGRLGRSFDAMATALEQLDRAKSTFVGTVSDELRTPLTSLRLSVANLADGVVGDLSPAQQKVIDRIGRDTDRLITRVGDLLALAKLDSGVETARLEELELDVVARASCSALEALARTRDVSLRVEGQGRARADRGMLERILINLIDNGIKFGPEGGVIEVIVDDGLLRVRDDGAGIDDPKLFEAFEQGATHGVKNSGAGLGLAIVQRLAKLQSARVSVSAGERSCVEVAFEHSGP